MLIGNHCHLNLNLIFQEATIKRSFQILNLNNKNCKEIFYYLQYVFLAWGSQRRR